MTAAQRENVRRYLASKLNGSRHRRPIDGDKVQCELCASTSDLEYHHKLYWSEGGDDSPANLQVLCRLCHLSVHQQKEDFRKNGQWGGFVSAYLREQRLGYEQFCEEMRSLARRRWAA